MILEIMLYLVLGIFNDVLATLYLITATNHKPFLASFLSFILTLYNFFIISRIVVSENYILMVAYAAGCAAGCWFVVKYRTVKFNGKKPKKKRKISRK